MRRAPGASFPSPSCAEIIKTLNSTLTMPITIRLVTESDELLAIYRQRYAVYVEELKYPQKWADHAARTVIEPLDATAHILGAFDDDGALRGSVRLNYGVESDFAEYVELYGMKRFGPYFPARLVLTTKMILVPRHRGGTLMLRLCQASFAHTKESFPKTKFCLIDTKPPLDSYFRRLGFRPTGPMIQHPAAGSVVPMAFLFDDGKHLHQIGSPLKKFCSDVDETESVGWYHAAFEQHLVAA